MQWKLNPLSQTVNCLQKGTLFPKECLSIQNICCCSHCCNQKWVVSCSLKILCTAKHIWALKTVWGGLCIPNIWWLKGVFKEQCQAVQHLTYFYFFTGKLIVLSFDQIPQQQHLRLWPERKEEGYVAFNCFPVWQFACVLWFCPSTLFINLLCFVLLGIDYREKAPWSYK